MQRSSQTQTGHLAILAHTPEEPVHFRAITYRNDLMIDICCFFKLQNECVSQSTSTSVQCKDQNTWVCCCLKANY